VLPGIILPLFYVGYRACLVWKTRRCTVEGTLSPGVNERYGVCTPQKRGIYTGDTVYVTVRDILGFTASSIPRASRNSLTVIPDNQAPPYLPRRSAGGGEMSAVRETVTRSDELLDARKYYPGDDIRRVNWNMFAHMGEVYIRIGEEVPPPSSRILVAVDASVPELFRPVDLEPLLDRAVAFACGTAAQCMDRGRDVWLSYTGAEKAVPAAGGHKDLAFRFFSGAWWSDGTIPLPEASPPTTFLFTFPSSPGCKRFLRSMQGRTFIFLPEPPRPICTGKKFILRRFLFREKPEDGRRATWLTPDGYYRLLEEDLRRFGHRERGNDVRTY